MSARVISHWAASRSIDPEVGERVFYVALLVTGGRFRPACAHLGASYPHAWEWLRAEPGRWERVVEGARSEVARGLLAEDLSFVRKGYGAIPTRRVKQGGQLSGAAWHAARARTARMRALF